MERADCILSKVIQEGLVEKMKFEQCLFSFFSPPTFFLNGHAVWLVES